MKYQDCKKIEKCKDNNLELVELCIACKKLSDYCKDCNKIYEDSKFYLEYIEVRKKHFLFGCEKCEKR